MLFLLVALVASQQFPNTFSGLQDSCNQAVDLSSTNSKYISFVYNDAGSSSEAGAGRTWESLSKCNYMALSSQPVPDAATGLYAPSQDGLPWPIYPRTDPATRYVFNCADSQYADICAEAKTTSGGTTYYPQNCRWESGNYLDTCTQRTATPRPSMWPMNFQTDKVWGGFSAPMDSTTEALITAKDGVDTSNIMDYAVYDGGHTYEHDRKWWIWIHDLGFQMDETVLPLVVDFMNPWYNGFYCSTCKTHFTYELYPYLNYNDEDKRNMVMLLWDLHNRAQWEIKAAEPYDWDMYPTPGECDTCRTGNEWNFAEVQKYIYQDYSGSSSVPTCVGHMSDQTACAASNCYFNTRWNVCQEELKCSESVMDTLFGTGCDTGVYTLTRDSNGCVTGYTCEGGDAGGVTGSPTEGDSSGSDCASNSERQDVKLVDGTAYVWDEAASKFTEVCAHYFADNNWGAIIICNNLGYTDGYVSGRGANVNDPYFVGDCFDLAGMEFPDCSSQMTCSGSHPTVEIVCTHDGTEYPNLTDVSCTEPVTTAEPTTANVDAYVTLPDYIYASQQDAEDACNGIGMSLCSAEQLFRVVFSEVDGYAGVSSVPELCKSGWISNSYNGQSAGWWHAADDGSCGSDAAKWHSWAPATPAAHCCADFEGTDIQQCGSNWSGCGTGTLLNAEGWCGKLTGCDNDACCTPWTAAPLYETVPSQYYDYETAYTSADEADAACQAHHADLRLCTRDQLEGMAKDYGSSYYWGQDMCSLGWYWTGSGETDATVGFYLDADFTSESEAFGCGTTPGFTAWIPTNSGNQQVGSAHCCVPSYVKSDYWALGSDVSEQGAQDYCAGLPYPKEVCTKYQLRTIVDMENANPCMAGYLRETSAEDTAYISGWWQGDAGDVGGCGDDFTYNIEGGWANDYRGAHCCESYVMQATTPAYYNGDWTYYGSQSEAAAQCTAGYSLCSESQLVKIATDGVILDDGETLQTESDICRFGWTAEGTVLWYQGEVGCAEVGWHTNTDSSPRGTNHCCTDFEGTVLQTTTTESPTFGDCIEGDVKIVDSIGYVHDGSNFVPICSHYFANGYMWGGDQVCQKLGYNGATVTAASGSIADGGSAYFVGDCWEQTFPHCTDQWDVCDGDLASTTVIECDGGVVADNTASCILPETTAPVTAAPVSTPDPTEAVVTESPTDVVTPEPVTDTPTTADPTEPVVVGDLPSSQIPPSDCVTYAFVPEGFEGHVSYCTSDGMVYLNGVNTCIPSDTANLDTALQNSWDNDWYLAVSSQCSGKDYDSATDDQLWITNEMCNNLEDDIDNLETSVDGLNSYMDDWTQSVIDLVNGQINNFDQATQDALNEYLATLQN